MERISSICENRMFQTKKKLPVPTAKENHNQKTQNKRQLLCSAAPVIITEVMEIPGRAVNAR
jgi:hypothetical protein